MMRKLIPFILFTAAAAFAQAEWTTYANQNDVKALAFSGSYLYAATTGGLLRMDTSDFSIEVFDNLSGLGFINCSALAVDSSGNLWIGHSNGLLTRRTPDGNCRVITSFQSAGWNIRKLRISHGFLFISSDKGFSLFSLEKEMAEQNFTRFGANEDKLVYDALSIGDTLYVALTIKPDSLQYNVLCSLVVDWDNIRSVNLDDPSVWGIRSVPSLISLTENQNKLEISGAAGFVFINNDRYDFGWNYWKYYKNGTIMEYTGLDADYALTFNYSINDLAGNTTGRLWAASAGGGILYYNGSQWRGFPQNCMPVNFTQAICKANDGAMWFSTGAPEFSNTGRGVMRLSDGKWSLFNASNTPAFSQTIDVQGVQVTRPVNEVTTIVQHPEGTLLMATWGNGIVAYSEDDGWRRYDSTNSILKTSVPGIRFEAITDLMIDGIGQIWAPLISRGVAVMNFNGTGKIIETNIGSNALSAIVRDSSARVWIGGRFEDYEILDSNDNSITKSLAIQTVDATVFSISVGGDGHVWIGTRGGLYRFSTDSISTGAWVKFLGGEEIHAVQCLPPSAQSETPMILAASYGKGLRLLDNNGNIVHTYTPQNSGLISKNINRLLYDGVTGELWITTEDGVSVFRADVFPRRDNFDSTNVVKKNGFIEFDFIPDNSVIMLYSLDGQLVRAIHPSSQRGVRWNLDNGNGKRVKPGLYYYAIKSDKKKKIGKLMVR